MGSESALTHSEVGLLLGAVNTGSPTGLRNFALLTVLAECALRISEACNLETQDLVSEEGQLDRLIIRNGKGGKSGQVVVTNAVRQAVQEWLVEREALGVNGSFVFCTVSNGDDLEAGKAVSPRYMREVVNRLAKKAGVKRAVSPHAFRHAMATYLLGQGVNMKVVSLALRHADVSTTLQEYADFDQGEVASAVRGVFDDGAEQGREARLVTIERTVEEVVERLERVENTLNAMVKNVAQVAKHFS